ncbi:MAG: glutamate--tRNA ligase [bacterium]|nr:glutamate--tRNA ligase [bacterium]
MMQQVRVRFAPSPTGYLHVGGARTALFNWLWARHTNGKFLLRIEDTDQLRSTPEAVEAILVGMKWLQMEPDEPVLFQMTRHQEHIDLCYELLERGAAYADFSDPEIENQKREAMTKAKLQYKFDGSMYRSIPISEQKKRMENEPGNFAIRLKIPEGKTQWNDIVHGSIEINHAELDDFVILRRDGTPVYNLAVVSDDHFQQINLVLRGDDHISNTPKQILIYQAMNWEVPKFGHLPMILGTDKVKLSKRHGATAVGDYQKLGILPEAMINFLALLGWAPGDDTEVMSIDELINRFSLERINAKAAVFDLQKLYWLNGQHISRTPTKQLIDKCGGIDQIKETTGTSELTVEQITKSLELWKTRVKTLDELISYAQIIWKDPLTYDQEGLKKQFQDPKAINRCLALANAFEKLETFTHESTEAVLRKLAEEESQASGETIPAGRYIHPCRLMLTGLTVGPGLFDLVVAIGKEAVVRRLRKAQQLT